MWILGTFAKTWFCCITDVLIWRRWPPPPANFKWFCLIGLVEWMHMSVTRIVASGGISWKSKYESPYLSTQDEYWPFKCFMILTCSQISIRFSRRKLIIIIKEVNFIISRRQNVYIMRRIPRILLNCETRRNIHLFICRQTFSHFNPCFDTNNTDINSLGNPALKSTSRKVNREAVFLHISQFDKIRSMSW